MNKLNKGIIAPEFNWSDTNNQTISLSNYRGKKLMLSFYRYASCPLCNLRVNDLISRSKVWQKKGFELIAVFQSPADSIKSNVGKQDSPFPILPDPKQTLYKKYGVSGNWGKFLKGVINPMKLIAATKKGFYPGKIETDLTMIPADFLIDDNGIIHTAYYGKDAADHLNIQSIEHFINS